MKKNILEAQKFALSSNCHLLARLQEVMCLMEKWLETALQKSMLQLKSASHMKEVKELLRKSGREVGAVENCTMQTEKVYRSVDEIPDDSGYFSLIVAKEKK